MTWCFRFLYYCTIKHARFWLHILLHFLKHFSLKICFISRCTNFPKYQFFSCLFFFLLAIVLKNFSLYICVLNPFKRLEGSCVWTFLHNLSPFWSQTFIFSFYAFKCTAMGLYMGGSSDASGSKSNTHCSGFGQISHGFFFPLVPTTLTRVVGTKWYSLKYL